MTWQAFRMQLQFDPKVLQLVNVDDNGAGCWAAMARRWRWCIAMTATGG